MLISKVCLTLCLFAGSVIVLGGGVASGELPVPKPNQPSPKGVRCLYSMLSKSPLSHLLKVYVFGIISGMVKLAWGPISHLPKNWVLGEHATNKFSFVCLRSMNSLPSYTKVFRSGQGVACALFMLCCSLLSYRWLSIYTTPTYPNLPQPNPPEPTPKLTTFFCTLHNLHFRVVSS